VTLVTSSEAQPIAPAQQSLWRAMAFGLAARLDESDDVRREALAMRSLEPKEAGNFELRVGASSLFFDGGSL